MTKRARIASLTALTLSLLVGQLNAQNYVLNGSATALGGDCYLLTPSLPTQNGTVWYTDQINLNDPFSFEFTMNFGTLDAQGADGIVFVLQTVGTTAIGVSGGGLGFEGFNPSFGIEFDTWQNTNSGDPFYDHIAFISNGSVNHNAATNLAGPVQAHVNNVNIEDGLDHIVKVVWDPVTMLIQCYFDCELRLQMNFDIKNLIFGGQNMVFWGFTAATGGSMNNQSVCLQDNIISVGPSVQICQGASAPLNVAGDPNGTYTWSPVEGLSDPNIQNPVATPDVTTLYTVTYTDFCGNQLTAQVLVEVEPLQVFAPASDMLTCTQTQIIISSFNNFNQGVVYNWSTQNGNIISGTTGPNITINQPGTYTLNISVNNECFASTSVDIEQNIIPLPANVGPDGVLDCNNASVTLSGSSTSPEAQYFWTTANGNIVQGFNSSTPIVDQPGTYVLTVTNPDNGCTAQGTVQVTDNTVFPNADAGPGAELGCAQPTAVLDGTASTTGPGITLTWTTQNGNILSGSNSGSPEVNQEGIYVMTVLNTTNGCSSSSETSVTFDESSFIDLSQIAYPNIFTPNSDGINDTFKPFLKNDPGFDVLAVTTRYELLIFNRWGTLIFEASETVRTWDGRLINGEAALEGIYYYIVRFESDCGIGGQNETNGLFHITR
jgi:gliding motility-associated-like protein